ncbi:MAG: ABC transporter permease [Bacilli bacterium]|jgi:simple sugar transport system permease protein
MNVLGDLISSMIAFAVPLILVALGAMYSERSGTINIALEGIMIIGGLVASLLFKFLNETQLAATAPQLCVLIGILGAAIVGSLYSFFLAFASIRLKADQTIGGTALNMLAPALAIVITWAIQGQGQTAIYTPSWVPLATAPIDANFFERIFLKSMYLTTPICILIIIATTIIIYKTKFGLRLRSCGENPAAADSVGINVYKMRYTGVMISGALAGIGGVAFTLAAGSGFASTVAGYGFLALAVMIFGNWQPLKIALAALLFAFFKSLSGMSSSIPFLPSFDNVKESLYIYLMIPYIVTMIILALTSKKSRAPKAEGIPYDKGSR